MDAKPEPKISRREDGSFLIDASTPVRDVVARLGLKEPQEQGLVTVAGLVLSKLDHGPQPGARVPYDGWDFEILEVDGANKKAPRVRQRAGSACSSVSTIEFLKTSEVPVANHLKHTCFPKPPVRRP